MNTLVDVLEKISADREVEMCKLAEEEAAGRIMARGFMDELTKVAQRAPVATIAKPPRPTLPGRDAAKPFTPPGMPGRMPRNATGTPQFGKASPIAQPKMPGFQRMTPKAQTQAPKAAKPFTPPPMPGRMPRNVTGKPQLGKAR